VQEYVVPKNQNCVIQRSPVNKSRLKVLFLNFYIVLDTDATSHIYSIGIIAIKEVDQFHNVTTACSTESKK